MLRAIVALLTCIGLVAGAPAGGRPSAVAASGDRDLPPAGLVTQTTLSNGLQLVVLVDRVAPVVSTWLNVRAGSDDEPYTGLAHAQEHMFYRGSASLSGAQADEIAGFTGDVDDADTQQDVTQFYHTVPSQDLDLVLHLDASRFAGLLDSQTDWDQERGAIEQEVTRDNSDASFRLYTKIQNHLMAGTAYADEGLGTLHSFNDRVNAPQLRAFYRAWYHPNNVVYVVAGDVDPKAVVASVTQYFGGFPSVPLPKRPTVRLPPVTAATFSDTSDEGSNLAMVAYRFPGLADRDYAASVVLDDVLNSQRGDAYGLVASGKALDIEADSTYFPHGGLAVVTAHVPLATPPGRAVTAIEGVIASYAAKGVPASLVDAAKQREFAQYATAGSSIRTLAETWSGTLPAEHRTPLQDVQMIAAVTPHDVDRVLRTYLVNATATSATAVPKNGATGEGGGGPSGEESKPEPTVLAPLPPWAQTALDKLGPPAKPEAPTEFTLSNGLHLIVRPDHSSASVYVAGSIQHEAGLEEPPGQAGVGSVVEALMPYGTTSLSRLQYQAQLDAISATVKTGFTFSLAGLSSKFERGVRLLADDELHPAFDANDFAIIRDQRAAAVGGEATSPNHLAAVALATGLYPDGDPARSFPVADELKSLKLSDVTSYYAKAFRPDLTTIAIVGDVTPETARATIERYFGAWSAIGAAPGVVSQPVRDNAAASTMVPANGVVQDTVTSEETLALGNDDPDVAPLDVASAMLSGDFSSILIRDMRVTTGYVYSVGTSVRTRRARGVFRIVYGCAPEKFSKAQSVLERDLTQIQTADVEPDRLQRAKSHLLSEYALSGDSYESLATALANDASEGLSSDALFTRVQQEFATTADAVKAATAKWLRPAGFVRTIEGPAPT